MKKMSLRTIYVLALSAVFIASLILVIGFDMRIQQKQAMDSMANEARVFAREMQAVWDFMDISQDRINYDKDGEYDFKGLHCAVVGKSIGKLFSKDNAYQIRYTTFKPRNIQNKPDEFERLALARLAESKDVKEYYDLALYNGQKNFRYLQELKVEKSCLNCHGTPVGEIDETGYAKEGWNLDSFGGAISIVIPAASHEKAIKQNVMRDVLYFWLITVLIGGVVLFITNKFVFRPLASMGNAFSLLQKRSFSQVGIPKSFAATEVDRLLNRFNEMNSELERVYGNLEDEVAERTQDLKEANRLLESQKQVLEELNAQLAEETSFKSNLLSMVNHELRTPLASIITLAQTSRQNKELAQGQNARAWEEIERNSQILLRMINDMLDIARSDAGVISANIEAIDLGDIVSLATGTLAPLAEKFQVTFTSHVKPNVPLVFGDYDKTLRMLENLGSNAIKFTPDGGKVDLLVTCSEKTGDVLISMSDTGIGIDKKDQERIFDRFIQVDSTSTRKYNGSGLGLALVKEYAALQGFDVSVESELGVGSTFTILIPSDKVVGI